MHVFGGQGDVSRPRWPIRSARFPPSASPAYQPSKLQLVMLLLLNFYWLPATVGTTLSWF